MKKLLVVLLALAFVGAVSAQVTTSLSASGKVNIAVDTSATQTAPQTGLAMGGEWNDAITFAAAQADGKYGIKLYYGQFNASADQGTGTIQVAKLTNWNTWYKFDWGQFDVGTAGGGFSSNLSTDFVDLKDTAGFGTGLIYTTADMGGLKASVYLNAPTTAIDTVAALQQSGASVQYSIEKTAKVQALVLAGLVNNDTKVNAFVDFTGVENMVVQAEVQWDQANAASLGGVEFAYTMDALKFIVDAETLWGVTPLQYGAGLRVNYKLSDALSFRLEGAYTQKATSAYYGKGYVYYTIGNGLSANLMLGYDSAAAFIYQAYLGYSVSL